MTGIFLRPHVCLRLLLLLLLLLLLKRGVAYAAYRDDVLRRSLQSGLRRSSSDRDDYRPPLSRIICCYGR